MRSLPYVAINTFEIPETGAPVDNVTFGIILGTVILITAVSLYVFFEKTKGDQ